jgi:hypothetical protein
MRLWTLDPAYLDARGLVALWREALLAQAVLAGETRGYRRHPQLERFRHDARPLGPIAAYLRGVHDESLVRGYHFDRRKISRSRFDERLVATRGQLDYEWEHLMAKLAGRDPARRSLLRSVARPKAHPLFRLRRGGVADWEVQH